MFWKLDSEKKTVSVLSILLIAGVNIVPIIYGAANSMQKGDLLGKILDEVFISR